MRILQVVHAFPPESIAGTERYCEALSQHLLRRGHECMVLAGSESRASVPTLATVEQDGLLVTRYLRTEGRSRRWTEGYDPEAEGLTRHLLALLHPDVVHLHQWQRLTNNLVAICSEMAIPAVVTLHDAWTSCPRIHRVRRDGAFCADPPATAPCLSCAERSPWEGDQEIAGALALRREMMELELALAAVIIAPSAAHRAFLLTLLGLPENRLAVVPHGRIPTVAVPEKGREQSGFPNRPLQIGHWGYLMYLKGTHLILEAVHKLRDPSAVQVHLIGTTVEQDYERRLRELAHGIPVQFHGAYQPANLGGFDLDLAIFASIASESYSFAIDEGIELRLPILVSDRGALPERIGAAGLTFRAGDAGDLARCLQEILDAPERLDMMRRSIRPDLLFSMEAHVTMMEKIYEDAAHDEKPQHSPSTPYLKLLTHAKHLVVQREATLATLQERLTQAEQALHDREALLERTLNSLRDAEKALHDREALLRDREALLRDRDALLRDREALLEERGRILEALQGEHAKLRSQLAEVQQTPLFKVYELLTKLSKRP